MKFRKYILHSFILIILLFSITAISAADLNTTDNMDVLTENEDTDGSFIDFDVDSYIYDTNFDLKCDYKYDNESDRTDNVINGIIISKSNYVINGNGHTIDCDNKVRAFNITGKNVEIKNLIIKNGFYKEGSAITTESEITLNNVTFINCGCNGTYDNYGAILSTGPYLTVNNCKFIDTYGETGASISAYNSVVTVTNSTFTSSSDKIKTGQINIANSRLIIENSKFLNTTSTYAAAIFAEDKSSINIINSTFKNLFATKTAGAVGVKLIDSLIITNCEFDSVSSENDGGAIFADINGDERARTNLVTISESKFNNCYSGFGGAILQLGGKLKILSTNFTSNTAEYEGGAIYTSFADVDIYDSNFKSNSLSDEISYGGACYFDMGNVLIKGDVFENNLGLNVSTLYTYDTNLTIQESYFNNPSNVTSLYSVYGNVKYDDKTNFTNDEFSFGNTNYNYNFENTANPIIITADIPEIEELPEKYDLRDNGWVSPVKDQGFMGACWAFGSLAALESAFMRYANITYSFSVNNMQNSMLQYSKYGRITAVEGGRAYSSIGYLIDWLGIFPDEYEGYDELGKISSLYITPENIHIQNVVLLPGRDEGTTTTMIKTALMKYGALSTGHYADFNTNKYYNEAQSALYYPNTFKSTDHQICIVGWDDNYNSHNFVITAPGDGAWIVKNSWGTDWGDNGYFYVSYYDTSIANDDLIGYIITNESYDRIYQNDIGGIGYWADSATHYANVFTADEDELIAAVGTFFEKEGQDYEFTISVNDVDVYKQKGVSSFSGYETIKLDKYVQIKKDDVFKVTFKNKMYYARLLRIHTQENKSFASSNGGKNWKDLSLEDIVAVLKAYTVSDLNMTQSLVKYYSDETPFIAKVGAGEEVLFQFNGENRTVKADENGLAKLEINCEPGKYAITTIYNNTAIVNYVMIKDTVISSDVQRGYNSNYNYKVQLVDSSGNPLNKTTVVISINDKFKNYTTDEMGYITLPFTKLTKQQKITVLNPSTVDVKTTYIKVVSRFSGAGNVAMYYFDGSKFKAKIIGDDGKAVGAKQKVTVKLNKKTYTLKTDPKGYITLKIPKTLKPGTYKLKATYKGQTITKTIKVKQNLKTKKYTVKKSAKKLTVKATLKNGKKALKNKKITLKINGKKITAKTNKKGIAKFTIKKNVIKKLKAGKKYTMKITYLKDTIKTTLKVKR